MPSQPTVECVASHKARLIQDATATVPYRSLSQISQVRGQELQRVASTAETLTAQAPSPGMVPAAEASAAGSLASLSTQVHTFCPATLISRAGQGCKEKDGWSRRTATPR